MYEYAKLMGTSLNEYVMQDRSIPISSFDVIGKQLIGKNDTKDGITTYSQLFINIDENNECNNKNKGKHSNALLSTDDKNLIKKENVIQIV